MEVDITITAISLNPDKVLYSTYSVGKLLDYIRTFSFESDGRIDNFFNVYFAGFPRDVKIRRTEQHVDEFKKYCN